MRAAWAARVTPRLRCRLSRRGCRTRLAPLLALALVLAPPLAKQACRFLLTYQRTNVLVTNLPTYQRTNLPTYQRTGQADQFFTMMDGDGDGVASKAEVSAFMTQMMGMMGKSGT